jgi:hypothetical protein
VTEPCIVLIAASDLLPALRERAGAINGDVLTFTDAEALRRSRHYQAAAGGRHLRAAVRRDAARRRDDQPHQGRPGAARLRNPGARARQRLPAGRPRARAAKAPALDQRGTRRAPRFKMAPNVTAQVGGKTAMLIDLSDRRRPGRVAAALKPNQQVAVALHHEADSFMASVVWTSFEIPPNSGRATVPASTFPTPMPIWSAASASGTRRSHAAPGNRFTFRGSANRDTVLINSSTRWCAAT